MTRRLRFNGTDSKNGACPAVHEDLDSGEIIVQGRPITAPDDLRQLQHFGPADAAVAVPRELLVNHGPKEMERVPKIIDLTEFGRLFHHFDHSAWHLETRRGYASDKEDPGYEEFLQTGQAPTDLDSEWCTNILRQTAVGKYVGRVRVVDNPPTKGQMFLLSYARCNAATGEDARNLWREDAEREHLPAEDFWIFDSRLVAVLRFDDQDVFHDVEIITEPAEVLRYCQVRDAAVHASIPYHQFAAQLDTKD
ncbi:MULTISPECIES: DUF6879 family protein [Streptomyces]|uniref:DUF6879 family protein n=1 Tax=Streptomyces TaxID=1883 RepID=UPI0029A849DE|nr:DUF6879 family protein [Streptomyces stelliscabiei]MDX2520610.1 hypothetical protein [Streptomyces stelliscabiei]MDX2552707.1 hypothetical protein [Streptomyces stelliscabiei]MDX2661391.1 hypothetical protein [Streptomyces stelliscabiei]MDX2788872.1 hypothetical protein [Streptomyces stelliscabiei]